MVPYLLGRAKHADLMGSLLLSTQSGTPGDRAQAASASAAMFWTLAYFARFGDTKPCVLVDARPERLGTGTMHLLDFPTQELRRHLEIARQRLLMTWVCLAGRCYVEAIRAEALPVLGASEWKGTPGVAVSQGPVMELTKW